MTTTESTSEAQDLNELLAAKGVKLMTGREFAEALRNLFESEEEKQEFLNSFDDFWPNEPDG